MRVIPWWEMVLDSDVGDSEDERFRGHVYYRPKIEVEEEYGLTDLSGTSVMIFFVSDILARILEALKTVRILSRTRTSLTTQTLFAFLRYAI
jgi:hypothetical protein